jgi:hypothetical protein
MTDLMRFDVEGLTEGRLKSVGEEIRRERGPVPGAHYQRTSWSTVVTQLISLLPAGVVLVALFNIVTRA